MYLEHEKTQIYNISSTSKSSFKKVPCKIHYSRFETICIYFQLHLWTTHTILCHVVELILDGIILNLNMTTTSVQGMKVILFCSNCSHLTVFTVHKSMNNRGINCQFLLQNLDESYLFHFQTRYVEAWQCLILVLSTYMTNVFVLEQSWTTPL